MCMSSFHLSWNCFKQVCMHTHKHTHRHLSFQRKHTMYTGTLFHPFLYISHTLTHLHRCPQAHTNTTYATEHMPPLTGKQYCPPLFLSLHTHTHLDSQTFFPPSLSSHTKNYILSVQCVGQLHRAPTYIPLPIIMHILWSNPPGSGVG